MIKNNPLFSKDSLMRAAGYISSSIDTLALYGSDKPHHRELRCAKWIIASIMDYVFHYLPVECYTCPSGERRAYPKYYEEFLQHPDRDLKIFVDTAEKYLSELTKENAPRLWNLEKEEHTISVLKEIQANKDEIISILCSPKKQELPKPTEEEISDLAWHLREMMDDFQEASKGKLWDSDMHKVDITLREYINTLAIAFQHYGYGAASTIYYGNYMDPLVLIDDTQEFIGNYIRKLEDNSLFSEYEDREAIISGLSKVLCHLIKEDYEYLEFEMY